MKHSGIAALEIDKQKDRDTMTKEKLLTVRWNNLLTLGLGLIFLIYIVVALSTSAWSTRAGMIGLAVIGVLF